MLVTSIVQIVCLLSFTVKPSSSDNWIVAFATIRPRFHFCNDTVATWLNQTIKPKHILIFVTPYFDSMRLKRNQPPILTSNLVLRSQTDMLRKKIARKFPDEYHNGTIQIIEIPKDYGPSTKLVGVLMSLPLFPEADYWVIGDDDLLYHHNLIEKYSRYYDSLTPPASAVKGPVMTCFNKDIFAFDIEVPFRKDTPADTVTVFHVQGADTYVLPQAVLSHQNAHALPLSYAHFPGFVEYMLKTCPHSYVNDDYLISYTMTIANLSIGTLWSGKNVYEMNDNAHGPSELHMEQERIAPFRGTDVITCLKQETAHLASVWNFNPMRGIINPPMQQQQFLRNP